MIVKSILAALAAGLIAGVIMTAAQRVQVVPLILHAEEFENAEPAAAAAEHHSSVVSPMGDIASFFSPVTPAFAHEHEAAAPGAEEEGGIAFGMSRFVATLLANLVTGAGFGLLLAGASLVIGKPVTLANGATWGAVGWLAMHLLPAVGLPPELPGFPAAELGDRQIWWVASVVLSAAGLYLLIIRKEALAKVAGILLIVAPIAWGAPQPADINSAVPAVLAAEFAVAALAVALLSWIVLGLSLGFLNEKLAKAA
ncbi:CbtA family protein [Pararhizobium sp.]|uniref:CbtA family protein n=1 Tax=Pararhizobium sp. TaxID=1977563 RepID=UPI00271990DF|nr:CbtA family protein [Pararhizobium sp.]MDO9418697.1 CbtA family protein [Pararhizobium sp.]